MESILQAWKNGCNIREIPLNRKILIRGRVEKPVAREIWRHQSILIRLLFRQSCFQDIWLTLSYIGIQFWLRYRLILFKIGYRRSHLCKYSPFSTLFSTESQHRASNSLYRARHNFYYRYFLPSLFIKRLSLFFFNLFITRPIGMFGRLIPDAKEPILNFSQITRLCVIFARMKFIKGKLTSFNIPLFSTAVLLNREISRSFVKTWLILNSVICSLIRIVWFLLDFVAL